MQDEISKKLEAEAGELLEKKGKPVVYSAAGPVGLPLVKIMATTIQNLESRIATLEARIKALESR